MIELIKHNVPELSEYHKNLIDRVVDDDDYDVQYCLKNNITPDSESFPTYDNFLDYVYKRCKDNVYYFLRNVVELPVQGGGVMNFKLNIGTLSFIEHYIHGYNALLQNPRQTFQTTTLACLAVYHEMFDTSNTVPHIVQHGPIDRDSHSLLRDKIKTIVDCIPKQFLDFVEKSVSKSRAETNAPKSKIVFIDDFEFFSSISQLIESLSGDETVRYYAVSTVNNNLCSVEIGYLDMITLNSVDNFGIITSILDYLGPTRLSRIWYDVNFFFTEDKQAELLEILGSEAYRSEVLRIRE